MSSSPARIYVASPLGFTDAGRAYSEAVILPALRSAGLEPLDPWSIDPEVQRIFDLGPETPSEPAASRKSTIGAPPSIARGGTSHRDAAARRHGEVPGSQSAYPILDRSFHD